MAHKGNNKLSTTKHTYNNRQHACNDFENYAVRFVFLKLIPATHAELPIWYGG